MTNCESCIKEVTNECFGCVDNPLQHLMSLNVVCTKSCPRYRKRGLYQCRPTTDGTCIRADKLVELLQTLQCMEEIVE